MLAMRPTMKVLLQFLWLSLVAPASLSSHKTTATVGRPEQPLLQAQPAMVIDHSGNQEKAKMNAAYALIVSRIEQVCGPRAPFDIYYFTGIRKNPSSAKLVDSRLLQIICSNSTIPGHGIFPTDFQNNLQNVEEWRIAVSLEALVNVVLDPIFKTLAPNNTKWYYDVTWYTVASTEILKHVFPHLKLPRASVKYRTWVSVVAALGQSLMKSRVGGSKFVALGCPNPVILGFTDARSNSSLTSARIIEEGFADYRDAELAQKAGRLIDFACIIMTNRGSQPYAMHAGLPQLLAALKDAAKLGDAGTDKLFTIADHELFPLKQDNDLEM